MPIAATGAPATAGASAPPFIHDADAPVSADSNQPATQPATERSAGERSAKTRSGGAMRMNIALFGLGVATFALLFSTQALLPQLAAAFGASPDQASWTVSAATIGLAAAVLPLSLLSERIGRQRMMSVSLAVAVVLALLIPFAPGLGALIALRALQGAALAGIPASAVAYLAEELDKRAMVGAVGLFIAGNSVGGMSGRILTGWTAEGFGWRVALLAVAALALAGALCYALLLPRARNFSPSSLSARQAVGSVAVHLRDGLQLRLYSVGMLLMAAFSAIYTAIAFRLTEQPFGLSAGLVGSVFVVYLVGTCSSSMTGPAVDRLGRRGTLYAGLAAIGTGLLLSLADQLATVLVGLVLITGGFFLSHAVASAAVGRHASRARAQASALYQVAYYLGASAGGTLGALTYHQAHWTGTVAFAGLTLTATAAVIGYATIRSAHAARLVPAA